MDEIKTSNRPFLRRKFLETSDDPKSLNVCDEAEAYIVAYRECVACINEVDECLLETNDPESAERYVQTMTKLFETVGECSYAAYVLEKHFENELERVRDEMTHLFAEVYARKGRCHEFRTNEKEKQNDR